MSFQDKLKQVDNLQKEIENYGKLPTEVLSKINYKFRLDWNYYSNRMEGNTLTLEETKSVMINNIHVNNKPLKDILEMKGHDSAIESILKMGKGDLNISESRVRDLHMAIMYEENAPEKEKIGKWKTQANHVINYKNEKFDFIQPSEVPEQMHALINWINTEKDKIHSKSKNAMHPVQLAFEFHLRYLTIHPFYDGNGRTGRILTNLILISYGYPPFYVKDEDKTIYYRYLADVQAYGAEKLMFFEIMADYLIRSLNIVLDAIQGREIEEPTDLDKKLQLLELELNTTNPDEEVKMRYGKESFLYCYENWITKLLAYTIPIIQKFNKLFNSTTHNISVSNIHIPFTNEPVSTIIESLSHAINNDVNKIAQMPSEFRINTFYAAFKKGGLKSFGCNYSLNIKFAEFKYEIFSEDLDISNENRFTTKQYERLLHQGLTDQEMQGLAQQFGNTIFKHIDFYTKKSGLR